MMSESLRIPSKDEITFSLFLPPKIASAVRLYGDVTIFDASASFLSLPDSGRLKKAPTEKALGEAKKNADSESESGTCIYSPKIKAAVKSEYFNSFVAATLKKGRNRI